MVERYSYKVVVIGSIPIFPTILIGSLAVKHLPDKEGIDGSSPSQSTR